MTASEGTEQRYETLRDLVDAVNAGREHEVIAYLDNDSVSFYADAGGDAAPREVLELHPSELQEQALAMLGIETEQV